MKLEVYYVLNIDKISEKVGKKLGNKMGKSREKYHSVSEKWKKIHCVSTLFHGINILGMFTRWLHDETFVGWVGTVYKLLCHLEGQYYVSIMYQNDSTLFYKHHLWFSQNLSTTWPPASVSILSEIPFFYSGYLIFPKFWWSYFIINELPLFYKSTGWAPFF